MKYTVIFDKETRQGKLYLGGLLGKVLFKSTQGNGTTYVKYRDFRGRESEIVAKLGHLDWRYEEPSLEEKIKAICPEAKFDIDDNDQIIVYTGIKLDKKAKGSDV